VPTCQLRLSPFAIAQFLLDGGVELGVLESLTRGPSNIFGQSDLLWIEFALTQCIQSQRTHGLVANHDRDDEQSDSASFPT